VLARNPRAGIPLLVNLEKEHYRRELRLRHNCRGLPSVDILTVAPGFREAVNPYTWLEGGSLVIDLALLRVLARRFEDCRYLEIGTWRGESIANVADIASECYSLSYSDDEMRESGWGDRFVATARVLSSGLPNVTHIGHDSRTFNFATIPSMDLIFIDGDHSYEGVLHDTRSAFQQLRGQDSIIVWHDYARSPERDVQWPVLAGILDGCPVGQRQFLYHVSHTLCAIYIPKILPTVPVEFPETPDKTFTVEVAVNQAPAQRRNGHTELDDGH